MPTFSADQIVGLQLYAKKRLRAYPYANRNADVLRIFEPGELVGTVFSWVEPADGVWWAFDWEKLKAQLDPDIIPASPGISPEIAGAAGLAALFFEDKGRNAGEKAAIRAAGYFGIGYALWKMLSKKLGEIDFNPFS